MKKSSYFFLFYATASLLACSDSDDANGSSAAFETPLNIANYWTYDVQNAGEVNRDSLYISNDTVIASKTYKKFKTKDNLATGFYSSALRNNGLRQENGKLFLSGDLSLNGATALPVAFDLNLSDFVIFNKNATNNQALNAIPKTGTINETVGDYPLTILYSLQSFGGETLPSYTSPNGMTYTNVKTTKIKLNVKITTTVEVFGSSQTIVALAPQDVLVSTQYLADGIGVVYSNTVTSYELNTLIATQLQIPASSSETQEEFLDTYLVN